MICPALFGRAACIGRSTPTRRSSSSSWSGSSAVAWIYVGHESQVKNPGDYFRTFIGRKPVVLVRDAEGEIRVIHNQCAHRGSLVVANDKGNTAEFQCCYHGWTYHLDGRLKAVPLQHGYPQDFDPEQSERPPWCR